ncbi:DNA polymerase III delta prime subunit [hydrothermal vent metagenome]|uniref:DNA polymerase III delta prime subunit n=1 Tax=hydrothermal vent metagenome TaxID=652676 RepID=A0A3B0U4C0_9ZZZZ
MKPGQSLRQSEQVLREADQISDVAAPEDGHDLVGHGQVYARLMAQFEAGRLAGGILLYGPRGIGKATLAFNLVRNILASYGDEPIGRIGEQIANGAHPNVRVLRKGLRESGKGFASEIVAAPARKIIHEFHQTRGRAGKRFCIVDAVDDCNKSAANALLKILEEPPADSHFILVSHAPGLLLPTIRSRCQAHMLKILPEDQLQQIVGNPDIFSAKAPQNDIDAALKLAGGRPRRALEALKLAGNKQIAALMIWLASPETGTSETILEIAEGLAGVKNAGAMKFARQMLTDWIYNETRAAAYAKPLIKMRLASANQLWDKANTLFFQTDTYNLDASQTMVTMFDAITKHARQIHTIAIMD